MNTTNMLKFLADLEANNSLEWMKCHREQYLEAKDEFLKFIQDLIFSISEFDSSVAYLCPEDLIFQSKRFDVVLLANVLHIVKEPVVLLTEMGRVLTDTGVLITATYCSAENAGGEYIFSPIQWLVRVLGIIKYLHCYRKDDVNALIQKAGFEIMYTEVLSEMPGNYLVAARK